MAVKSILSFDIGIKTLSFCHCVYENDSVNVKNVESINVLEENGYKRKAPPKVEVVANFIIDSLERRFSDLNVDYIVIEQQPYGPHSNTKMKIFSYVVYSYFAVQRRRESQYGNPLSTLCTGRVRTPFNPPRAILKLLPRPEAPIHKA